MYKPSSPTHVSSVIGLSREIGGSGMPTRGSAVTALLLLVQSASAYHASPLSTRHRSGKSASRVPEPALQYEVQAETVKLFGDSQPNSFVTWHPYFTVSDWTRARAAMEGMLAVARKEASTCMYYGFTVSGDQLFCRAAYSDSAGIIAHFEAAGQYLDQLTDDAVATVDEISLHGPADELEACRVAFGAMASARSAPPPSTPSPSPPPPPQSSFLSRLLGGADTTPPSAPRSVGPNSATAALLRDGDMYALDGGVSFITKQTGGPSMGQRFCTIHQTFVVEDWEQASSIVEAAVERVQEAGECIHYGFTRCADKLHCRQAYASAKYVLKHVRGEQDASAALLAPGVATLERAELHGPMAQLELYREAMREATVRAQALKAAALDDEAPESFEGLERKKAAEAAEAAARDSLDGANLFTVDQQLGGFQRYESIRLGGFTQD